MRLSVVTPVFVEIARAAYRLGYHHLTCSEHVGIPTEVAKLRGATYWDPLATFASACTDALGALAEAGTTIVAARLVHHSLAHYLEQLEALVGLAAPHREAV